jgi:hypothetical protein
MAVLVHGAFRPASQSSVPPITAERIEAAKTAILAASKSASTADQANIPAPRQTCEVPRSRSDGENDQRREFFKGRDFNEISGMIARAVSTQSEPCACRRE